MRVVYKIIQGDSGKLCKRNPVRSLVFPIDYTSNLSCKTARAGLRQRTVIRLCTQSRCLNPLPAALQDVIESQWAKLFNKTPQTQDLFGTLSLNHPD